MEPRTSNSYQIRWWRLVAVLLLPLLSACVADRAVSVSDLFFSSSYVVGLGDEQRRSLINLALSDTSVDALALVSQLHLYLALEKDPAQQARQRLGMAKSWLARKMAEPALIILEQILAQQIDASFPGLSSLRGEALALLASFSTSPFQKSSVITELVNNYKLNDKAKASWYYQLGESLEQIQRWDEAMAAYQNFANYPDVKIAGMADAHSLVKSKLDIYNSKRRWYTSNNLEQLVADIRYIVVNNHKNKISSYMANDFFAISGNFTNASLRRGDIYLPNFLSPNVRFGQFTAESNDQEAWLETHDWPLIISRWYLYFRRINYPANPKINGEWEWAGIFIGELL